MDLLEYVFFWNALIGGSLAAVAYGIVRTYIIFRQSVFISGGITCASFDSSGSGFYLGTNLILMAMLFSIPPAFGVGWASRTQNIREDSAIADVWSLGIALGVTPIFLTPRYVPNLSAYLFGNILTTSTADILWTLGLAVLLIFIFSLFLRGTVYVVFDRDSAVTQGLSVKWIKYTMMCFVAMAAVLSIHLVGIMLLTNLLTLPQVTVDLFTSDFRKITRGSITINFLSCVSGLVLSCFLDVPSSAFIILFLVVLFLVLKVVEPLLWR